MLEHKGYLFYASITRGSHFLANHNFASGKNYCVNET